MGSLLATGRSFRALAGWGGGRQERLMKAPLGDTLGLDGWPSLVSQWGAEQDGLVAHRLSRTLRSHRSLYTGRGQKFVMFI